MKKIYRVPVKFVFEGFVDVETDCKNKAWNIAQDDFCAIIGNVSNSNNDKIVNWDVKLFPKEKRISTNITVNK